MTLMLIVLAAAAAALGLARLLRVPSIPLLVVAGAVISAGGLADERHLLQDALLLGLMFLLFAAGVEMDPARVGGQRAAAVRVGVAQFFLVALLAWLVALALGLTWLTALYVALAVTASSTLIVVRLLRERRQMFEPFGRLVVGVLLLQDLLMILLIAAVAQVAEGPVLMAWSLAGTLVLMLAAYLGLRWLTPWLLLRRDWDQEDQLLLALAILFVFIGAAQQLGTPLVAGAFLGGMALSGFPVAGLLRGQLASLSDFFLAVFFVALGAVLTMPDWSGLLLALALAALVLVITPPLVAWIALRAGFTARPAMECGLLLAQTSEFSLILGLIGVQQAHIDDELLAVIAIATVVTMTLTPVLATDAVAWRLVRLLTGPRRPPRRAAPPGGHVLLVGCGEHGLRLLDRLLAAHHEVVVIDDDAAVAAELESRGVHALRGDGADPRKLTAAGACQARLIISTMRRLADNQALLRSAGDVPVLVRALDADEADRLQQLGAVPVLADAQARWVQELRRVGRPPRQPPEA